MITKNNKTQISLAGLEGMQSVRTTFRLSTGTDELLETIVKASQSTTKELLDKFAKIFLKDKTFTDIVIDNAKKMTVSQGVRKTFVISKTALTLISTTAQLRSVSRDALVESIIVIADGLIKAAKLHQPENHKKAQTIIGDFWKQADVVEKKLRDLLGDEDPVYIRFGYVCTILMNLSLAIDAEIENGTPVDPDDIGQQS